MEINRVWFRFFEELNDFLPIAKRGIPFLYLIRGNPSVKDSIEALGVPHVDVDMIIVNGEPVDFTRKLKDKDQISVYPVFESFDISGVSPLRAKPLRETKFILDVHLGKLVKYLRLCGLDTLYKNHFSDNEIIGMSLSEHRIILTRDRGILKNRKVTHGYWIRSQNPQEQLKEVLQRFDLKKSVRPFIRCLECNGELADIAMKEIVGKLQPKTRKYYTEFRLCNGCNRIYWEGSHYDRMKKFVDELFLA
ncbi:MAG: Mut7-C RNAse domain-containing protein [Bacteroidales bacterium]